MYNPCHHLDRPIGGGAATDADDLFLLSTTCRAVGWVLRNHKLVSELVDVVGKAVEGVGGFVDVGAVVGALAGLDHHDVLVEGLTVLAAELDTDGPGVVGAAAAAVHTGTAVPGPVLLQAGAAGVGVLDRLAGLLGSAALLSFLRIEECKEGLASCFHQKKEGFYMRIRRWWWLRLTFRLEYVDWVHGRTSQILVSLTSLHSLLLLVTLVEMPSPQLLEHWDQGVV